VECGRPFFRSHAQGDSQAIKDRTSIRYRLTASHWRHNAATRIDLKTRSRQTRKSLSPSLFTSVLGEHF
jgi:hypothetical protein